MTWAHLWAGLALLILGLELFAAFVRRAKGDTITEQTRPWIRQHPYRTAAAVAAWAWLGFHYFVDGP